MHKTNIEVEWRELFKKNVPLSTIIDSELRSFILYSLLGGGGAGLAQW